MSELPKNWPRISSTLFYNDPAKAIDWICKTFGFEVQLKVEGDQGQIEHCELVLGDGLIMIGQSGNISRPNRPKASEDKSPHTLAGANTQNLCIYVNDVDAHCQKARAEKANILVEPATDDYGEEYWTDRSYQVEDLEGHRWWFVERVRDQNAS